MNYINAHVDGKLLSGDVTHYVVPDAGVVRDFLEVLEFRELSGVVFTQTACQALQNTRGRRYNTKRCICYSSTLHKFLSCGSVDVLLRSSIIV